MLFLWWKDRGLPWALSVSYVFVFVVEKVLWRLSFNVFGPDLFLNTYISSVILLMPMKTNTNGFHRAIIQVISASGSRTLTALDESKNWKILFDLKMPNAMGSQMTLLTTYLPLIKQSYPAPDFWIMSCSLWENFVVNIDPDGFMIRTIMTTFPKHTLIPSRYLKEGTSLNPWIPAGKAHFVHFNFFGNKIYSILLTR